MEFNVHFTGLENKHLLSLVEALRSLADTNDNAADLNLLLARDKEIEIIYKTAEKSTEKDPNP